MDTNEHEFIIAQRGLSSRLPINAAVVRRLPDDPGLGVAPFGRGDRARSRATTKIDGIAWSKIEIVQQAANSNHRR